MNFRDDNELVIQSAKALSGFEYLNFLLLKKKNADILPKQTEVVLILGDKANILGALMAQAAGIPWIVLV